MGENGNGGSSSWTEWAKYVLKTLEELKAQGGERDKLLNKMITEIKIMQTKMTMRAGFTGALAGFLPAAAIAIYALIKLKNGTPP
jgi:hypothetical protein